MIGELMLRRSTRTPSEVRSSPDGELVADEQIVGDPLHLPGIEQHRAAPPGLEIEEARGLGVDLGIDVVGLLPVGVGRVQRFEVGDQVGAVEDAVAEVAGQRGQPGAAQHAAEIAHRVLAAHAGPVGQRRARQHDRAGKVGPDRGHHHDLPAGLAVADRAPACPRPRDGARRPPRRTPPRRGRHPRSSGRASARAGSRRNSRDGRPPARRRSRCPASCRRCRGRGRRAGRRR